MEPKRMECFTFASIQIIINQMNADKLLELLFYTLPALITGGVAYYLFTAYFNDQQNTRQ